MTTLEGLARWAEGTAGRMATPDPWAALMPVLERMALEEVRGNFDRQAAPDGTPWPPLKRRQGRPLVKTGALLASIIARTEGLSVVVGSPLPYAGPQNYGARTRRGGRIPAREFIGLRPGTTAAMAQAAARHGAGELLRGLRGG